MFYLRLVKQGHYRDVYERSLIQDEKSFSLIVNVLSLYLEHKENVVQEVYAKFLKCLF